MGLGRPGSGRQKLPKYFKLTNLEEEVTYTFGRGPPVFDKRRVVDKRVVDRPVDVHWPLLMDTIRLDCKDFEFDATRNLGPC